MNPTIALVNELSAYAGLALALGAVILAFDYYTSRSLAPLVRKFGDVFLLAVVIGAILMTLLYSEIFGFIPCSLCWFQRIFLYAQPFVLATGMYLRDTRAYSYTAVLSVPGFIVAMYQHYIQMGGSEVVNCPASAGDCAQRFLFEFGFVTFPLIAAFLFMFTFALSWYAYRIRD
jgi:disulfide bond formation protein DsbB